MKKSIYNTAAEKLVYKAARGHLQYRHTYPCQDSPQPAFFELSEGYNTILPQFDGEIGGAIPFSVWYGRDRRYYFDPTLPLGKVNQLGRTIMPLLERVRAGIEIVWNGQNYVATLSDDAKRAETEIKNILENA